MDGDVWPRIWWIGSGLLNILPIHAAGYHEAPAKRTALDRVISSYSPSLKALAYARCRATEAEIIKSQEMVFVGMPKTPALTNRNLPGVTIELNMLLKIIPTIRVIMKE